MWFMHAVLAGDWYLQGLNVVGVTAGALQLALILLYPTPADLRGTAVPSSPAATPDGDSGSTSGSHRGSDWGGGRGSRRDDALRPRHASESEA